LESTVVFLEFEETSSKRAYSSTNNQNILEETDDKFIFPEGALLSGKDNVITIVQVKLEHWDVFNDPLLNYLCIG
jgi:hypothetical protein